jgi:hypothetical protein
LAYIFFFLKLVIYESFDDAGFACPAVAQEYYLVSLFAQGGAG